MDFSVIIARLEVKSLYKNSEHKASPMCSSQTMKAANSQKAIPDVEADFMKKDFFRSLIINGFFIISLVALYLLNNKFGFLDLLAEKF